MKPMITFALGVETEIAEISAYLGRADARVSERFVALLNATIEELAEMPELGARWESNNTKLNDLRFRPTRKFKNHLIFYRIISNGIEVAHVVQGSRNIERILNEE